MVQLTDRQVRGVRRLLLSAVLRVEETDLRLREAGVPHLREQLLKAAGELVRAADGLTNPELLSEGER